MQEMYISVIGSLKGPPTKDADICWFEKNWNKVEAIVSAANRIARYIVEKNNFVENFAS